MTRVLSILAWTAGAFLATAIAGAMAAAFASGVVAYFFVFAGSSSVSAAHIMGWAVSIALIFAFMVAGVVLTLGLRGRLPGTRLGGPSAPPATSA